MGTSVLIAVQTRTLLWIFANIRVPHFGLKFASQTLFVPNRLKIDAHSGRCSINPDSCATGRISSFAITNRILPAIPLRYTLAKLLVLVQGHFVSRITTAGLISPSFSHNEPLRSLIYEKTRIIRTRLLRYSLRREYPPRIFATSHATQRDTFGHSVTRATSIRQNLFLLGLRTSSSSRSTRSVLLRRVATSASPYAGRRSLI